MSIEISLTDMREFTQNLIFQSYFKITFEWDYTQLLSIDISPTDMREITQNHVFQNSFPITFVKLHTAPGH